MSKVLNTVPNAEVIWENFGLALLKIDDNAVLKNFKGDIASRCKALLDYWEKVRMEEGWEQIIAALREEDDLKALAGKLDQKLQGLKQDQAQASNKAQSGQGN